MGRDFTTPTVREKSERVDEERKHTSSARHTLSEFSHFPLYLLLAAFLALGVIYDTVTPIFEASDEQSHYPYIKHLADGNGLPLQDPQDIRAWRQEGSQPPLYYLLMALATLWIDTGDFAARHVINPHAIVGIPAYDSNDNRNMLVHTPAENFPYQRTTLAIHWIRWLSLLMGAGTVYAIYRLAWRITQHADIALLSAALVAFNPMFIFISTAVNNDNLITLLATLSLWQMICIWQDGLTPRRVLMLGVLVGLATLTKLSGLGLIGVAGLLILARSRPTTKDEARNWRRWAIIVGQETLFVLPILLIAGWWYARNFMLYGDPSGLNRMLEIVGTRQGTPALLPLLQAEFEGLRLSFWGLFGGVNILAAPWVYWFFAGVQWLALLGWLAMIVAGIWRKRWVESAQAQAIFWLVLWLVVLLGAWTRWTLVTPATQGRLIFPAMAAIVIPLALGLQQLLPFRFVSYATLIACVLFFSTALSVALFDIAPSYRPSPLITASERTSTSFNAIRFGDALELIDVELSERGARPGDTLTITTHWQAIAPMPKDYSLFVHLLDAGDLLIGQRDSYPGLGLRPTTQLRVGDLWRETYRLKIDETAIAPSRPEIRVGVYDFVTGERLPARAGAQALGDNPTISTLELLPTTKQSGPIPVTFNFEKYFTLVGYQIDHVAVRAGDALTLTLHWQVNSAIPRDYSIFTHVLGKQDSLWGQVDRQQPMTTWQVGQRISDVYVMQVKPETTAEVYELEIGAYDLNDNFKRLNIWGADGQFVGNRILLRKIRVVR